MEIYYNLMIRKFYTVFKTCMWMPMKVTIQLIDLER